MIPTNKHPLIVLLLLLSCCGIGCRQEFERSQRATILVWHDWPEPQSAALEELLRGFEEVHPEITIVVEYVADDELRETMLDQAAAGLGPDLIIESDMTVVAELVDAGLLVDLKMERIETDELLPQAVDALRWNDGLYGIPFAAHTNILYFNKQLIPTPPASIDDLRTLWTIEEIRNSEEQPAGLVVAHPPAAPKKKEVPDDPSNDTSEEDGDANTEQSINVLQIVTSGEEQKENTDSDTTAAPTEPPSTAGDAESNAESIEQAKERVVAQIGSFAGRSNGRQVALSTDFYHAFWGIRAHGGNAFNDDGHLEADAGFVEWLKLLLKMQRNPAIILDNNYTDLMDSFANGRTALMIGDSAEFVELQRRLGVENLGISTLPQGAKASGGLLELEVVSMSTLTSRKQVCADVIRYLCNEISQRKIALSEVGQIPVNRNMKFDARLMPVAATLKEQINDTTTIPLTKVRSQEQMFEIGNEIYLQVLAGVLEPDDAAEAIRQEVKRREEEQEAAE
jgi:ABC-type glycerol-3-phosphate transport system substrate-binding protein